MFDPNKPGTPIVRMDKHVAAFLNAAGYEATFYQASWQDIGGPESGPKLHGYPDTWVWSRKERYRTHEIVVVNGDIVNIDYVPNGPEGWEVEF